MRAANSQTGRDRELDERFGDPIEPDTLNDVCEELRLIRMEAENFNATLTQVQQATWSIALIGIAAFFKYVLAIETWPFWAWAKSYFGS